jgi:hypothetical protein
MPKVDTLGLKILFLLTVQDPIAVEGSLLRTL